MGGPSRGGLRETTREEVPGLYPFPFSLLFGGRLQFIARAGTADAPSTTFTLAATEASRPVTVVGVARPRGAVSDRAIFLTDAEAVVCQLVVSEGANVKVDTPNGLLLGLGANSVFGNIIKCLMTK